MTSGVARWGLGAAPFNCPTVRSLLLPYPRGLAGSNQGARLFRQADEPLADY